jgi:transcriptional regulator
MKSSAAALLFLLACTPALATESGATEADVSALEGKARDGDRESIRQLFQLFQRSDGAVTEAIDIALGRTIRRAPKVFLEELQRSGIKASDHFLGGLLCNLGDPFVDRFKAQTVELKKRRAALLTVKDKPLLQLRDICVRRLDQNIEETIRAAQETKEQAK